LNSNLIGDEGTKLSTGCDVEERAMHGLFSPLPRKPELFAPPPMTKKARSSVTTSGTTCDTTVSTVTDTKWETPEKTYNDSTYVSVDSFNFPYADTDEEDIDADTRALYDKCQIHEGIVDKRFARKFKGPKGERFRGSKRVHPVLIGEGHARKRNQQTKGRTDPYEQKNLFTSMHPEYHEH